MIYIVCINEQCDSGESGKRWRCFAHQYSARAPGQCAKKNTPRATPVIKLDKVREMSWFYAKLFGTF
jgi:hypothetical protein